MVTSTHAEPLLLPSHLLQNVGGSLGIGDRVVSMLRSLCGLQPSERILDVGCGVGRIAVSLTTFLDEHALYEGFDPGNEAIAWCQSHITSRFPNFHFRHADLYCPLQNPTCTTQASSFTFPYPDASFDVVLLNSVFTHLFLKDVEWYLSEIARVLKPGGRTYITYFLRPPKPRWGREQQIIARLPERSVPLDSFHSHEHAVFLRKEMPESMVVHEQTSIVPLYAKHHLVIRHPIYRGYWSRDIPTHPFGDDTYQDLIIAHKRRPSRLRKLLFFWRQ